jgi:hypothetical protein
MELATNSQHEEWRFLGCVNRVALVRTDVSEERVVSIKELETKVAC